MRTNKIAAQRKKIMTQGFVSFPQNFLPKGTTEEKEYLQMWLGTPKDNYAVISKYSDSLPDGEEKSWWEAWKHKFSLSTLEERKLERRDSDSIADLERKSSPRLERRAPDPISRGGGAPPLNFLKYVTKVLLVWRVTHMASDYIPELYNLAPILESLMTVTTADLIGTFGILVATWQSAGWVYTTDEGPIERASTYLGELMERGKNLLTGEGSESGSGSVRAAVAVINARIQLTVDRTCICESKCAGDPAECTVRGKTEETRLCELKKGDRARCHKNWRSSRDLQPIQFFLEAINDEKRDAEISEIHPRGGGAPRENPFSGLGFRSALGEPSYYTTTLAYALTMLIFGAGVRAVAAVVPVSVVLQSFLVIISALYALTATARVAGEMLNTITNLLLNAGLEEEFFDVRDDSLGAFLQRLETAVVPSQIFPILFSHVLDPLRNAFLGVVDPSFCAVYERVLWMLHTGRLSDEISANIIGS